MTLDSAHPDLVIGADGLARCRWVGDDAEYRRYHDEEWGRPLHGDRPLFEKLSLEAFQSGLSWITILRRRPGFRTAFADFDIPTVAAFDADDVDRLMADAGIIRNRMKIDATIGNARVVASLIDHDPGALDRIMWSFAPEPGRARPVSFAEVPAITTASTAMSRELKRMGLKFVGPTTIYALMQSAGMVDDHLVGCHRAQGAA